MMEKGVSKYWTPETEEHYERVLAGCRNFAERHMVMLIRDIVKYDGRSKQAKRAIAQARLRLATATDEELAEMAALDADLAGEKSMDTVLDRLKKLEILRAYIRKKGINKEELRCR